MAIDWAASDERLYGASVAAIRRFTAEHSDEAVCFFAFDTDPKYGYVLISLDTLTNNIRAAKRLEAFAVEERLRLHKRPDAWESAKYHLSTPVLSAFNTNSGDFAYSQYTEVQFPEWRDLVERGDYPVGLLHTDDYLQSSVRLVLWRVSERLISEGAFNLLKLASPFMVGYGIHDQEQAILRLLNWPAES